MTPIRSSFEQLSPGSGDRRLRNMLRLFRCATFFVSAVALAWSALPARSQSLPVVTHVEAQPLAAQVTRVITALEALGAPLSANEQNALQSAVARHDDAAVEEIQKILDPHCLVGVEINPEMRVKIAQGPVRAELVEQGWRTFLIKVRNQAGATSELRVVSPNAQSVHDSPWRQTDSDKFYKKKE